MIILYDVGFFFFVCLFLWCVNRFLLQTEQQTLALVRKNTNSKSTEANKETEVNAKNRIAAPKLQREKPEFKCRALTEFISTPNVKEENIQESLG